MPWGTVTGIQRGKYQDEGRSIVLVHSLAQGAELWSPFAEHLARDYHVVALDVRGHGASSWDGNDFSIEDLADDSAQALQEIGVKRAAVLGMSMGGCVAMAIATRHPQLVDRLILADTTADYGPGKQQAWAQRAATAVGKPRPQQLSFQLERWFSPEFIEADPAEVERVSAVFVATDSTAHAAACRALGQFEHTAELAKIVCPTLILVGEDDQATPVPMALGLHAGIAGSTLSVLARTRHMSLVENRQSWQQVRDFLRGDQ